MLQKNIVDPHQKPLQRDIGILLFLEIKNGFNGGRPERKILVLCSVKKNEILKLQNNTY